MDTGFNSDLNENEIEIDLAKLAKVILTPKNILLILLSGIIFGLVALGYSKFVLTEMYDASVVMYVNSRERTLDSKEALTNLTVSRDLADSYVVVLSNDVVMEEVGAALLQKYTPEQLEKYFSVDLRGTKKYIKAKYLQKYFKIEPVNETEVLRISASTPNPQLSADMCNAMKDIAPGFLKRVVGAGSVEAIGAAVAPDTKSSPNNTKNAVMGAALGIMLACGLIVLKTLMDNKIRDAESFKKHFDFPVMGEIPLIAEGIEDSKKREGYGVSIGSFTAVEAFNTLCNNLMVSMHMNDEKVIVVSSPGMGDGKSTIAFNMAKNMAKMGSRVLLMDLDLRRPSIHKKLKISNKKGFIDIIGKKERLENIVLNEGEGCPDILLSGGMSPNPSEMLSSKRFTEIIESCKQKYDFIIVDAPPVNMVTDACIISRLAAGILVVVRADVTRFEDFKKVADNISLAHSSIIGVAVNGIQEKAKRYGGKRYGYGYSYYEYSADKEPEKDS